MFKKYIVLNRTCKVVLPAVLFSFSTLIAENTITDELYAPMQYEIYGKWPKLEKTTKQGSFATSFKSFKVSENNVEKELLSWFNLSEKNSFIKLSENIDEQQIKHVKYQQYYNDIPLSGKVIMVHSRKGSVLSINGQVGADFKLNTTPSISVEQAVSNAKNEFGIGDKSKVYTPELVIYTKVEDENVVEVLAYEFRIDSFTPFLMKNIWVDAETGEVINSVSLIANTNINGTGVTYYYGNQTIAVEQFNDGYRLRDNSRNIETYDGEDVEIEFDYVNYEILYLNKKDFVSATPSFSLNPAIDAHWGMEKTYDYYKNTFNRLSFDGNNSKIISYYNPGIGFIGTDSGFPNNAVAMPEPFNIMAFGMGDGVNYDPVVGIDVAGHEFTHLVLNNNGSYGLKYQGESGALNESFADIFGTSIENYALGADSNWFIGEGIILYGSKDYMRNMQNPKDTRYPDTYKGTYWANTANLKYDNGGVHINSSVQNYWFYLLVEGGAGTNDLGNNYNVDGVGRAKAERIAYHNMMNYLSYNATFMDAYEGSLQIAEDFYGLDSPEYNSVANAWYAVGIGEGGNLSVGDFEVKSKLKVYPNPVVDGFIRINTDFVNPIAVEVYNLMGQKVLKEQLTQGENSIGLGTLTNGVYMFVFDINGKTHTEKIIINQ